jgi:bacterioferritin
VLSSWEIGRKLDRRRQDQLGDFTMKGNAKLIDALNDILTAELTAINQYFIHARMCEKWGYLRLAQVNRDESIGEMKDADDLIGRILDLDGVPNMQPIGKLKIGRDVVEQLKSDLDMEADAVARLNKAIALSVEVGDNRTRELLDGILVGEDKHLNWLETQVDLIARVGEQNYLAQQIHKSSD